MKRIALFLSVAVLMTASFTLSAQGKYGRDSAECIKYLSFYQQYMKQGNVKEAAPLWRKAISLCPPTANQNMLLDGLKIVRKDIIASKDNPQRIKELVDTVKMLHKMRIDTYPKYSVQAYSALSVDLLSFFAQLDLGEVFEMLDVAMGVTKEKTPVAVPVKYLDIASTLYKDGKIEAEKVLGAYEKCTAILNDVMAAAKDDNAKGECKSAMADLDKVFSASGVASCENLVAIYGPKFEANPDDKGMLASMVSAFGAQNCVEEELFRKAVESLHKHEASANSAHALFLLFAKSGDYDKAISYMEEAINFPESDASADALYYLELAQTLYKGSQNAEAYKAARSAAEKATEIGNSDVLGKTYFLIAQIWGGVKCGGNEVESRAPFWVAVDYLVKAKNADASLADEANKMIGAFSSYFPAQSDAFMYDMIDGTSYTVSCGGMSASTIVRTQK